MSNSPAKDPEEVIKVEDQQPQSVKVEDEMTPPNDTVPAVAESTHSPSGEGESEITSSDKKTDNGVTAKGDPRHFVKHIYTDRSNEVIEHLSESDENTLRLYREDNIGGTFPIKLQIVLKVIEKLNHQHIISWLPHGRSFMIHRPREFEEDIMGKFFKQTKLTSFQRQLNLYDFQRITHGRDAGSYYHELFLRGKPLLAKRMIRRKVKGTKTRGSSSPDDEPNFYSMPFMGPASDMPTLGAGAIGHFTSLTSRRNNGGLAPPGSDSLGGLNALGSFGGGNPAAALQGQFGGAGSYGQLALQQLSNISALQNGSLLLNSSMQQNPNALYADSMPNQMAAFGGGANSFLSPQATGQMGNMNSLGALQRQLMNNSYMGGEGTGMLPPDQQLFANNTSAFTPNLALMNQEALLARMRSGATQYPMSPAPGGGFDPNRRTSLNSMGGVSEADAFNAQLMNQIQQMQQTQQNQQM